jgi:hypothetical protein
MPHQLLQIFLSRTGMGENRGAALITTREALWGYHIDTEILDGDEVRSSAQALV